MELHNRDIDHLCSSTTATIALQLELKVVVVVGANNVNAAEPVIQHAKKLNVFLVLVISSRVVVVVWANFVIAADLEIQHAYTTNDLLVLEILIRNFPVIGLTLSQTESKAPPGVKNPPPHDIATQTPPSVDEEHEVTTVAVATMVQPFKGTVNDITVGSATGAVNTNVPLYFPLETGSAKSILIPKPRSDGRHNS